MTGITGLGQLDAGAEALRLRLQMLTRQVSTGRVADAPGDLGAALSRSLDLSADIARRDTYGTAIGTALNHAGVAQTALQRLGDIARAFGDGTAIRLDPNDPDSIPLAASAARQALVEVGQLLNTSADGVYLFGGSDSANRPVPDPDNLPAAGFATQIASAVATLGGGNAAAVTAATMAAAQSDAAGVTPFSGFLSDPTQGLTEPRQAVPAADGVTVPVGLFANRNAAAVSAGETTGSWARDLMRGLATIASLTPAQAASPADFRAVVDVIRNGLQSAAAGIADEAGALGQTEARLTALQDQHDSVTTTLTAQLSDIRDVDMAQAITQL
ncbi:MAG TPA: hypothetical protein VE684_14140, partial [Crenalkalicoccus sp.]|nr:hypothetical protein [Crenalkalicoccus sp.]